MASEKEWGLGLVCPTFGSFPTVTGELRLHVPSIQPHGFPPTQEPRGGPLPQLAPVPV